MVKSDLTFRLDKGIPLTHAQHDANFDRLMYWSGPWATGRYTKEEVVTHDQVLWICAADQTWAEPDISDWVAGTLTDWQPLSRSATGFGTMSLSGTVAGANIGATWDPLNQYNTVPFTPLGMTLDQATGQFTFTSEGVWELTFQISLAHNESNASRRTGVRLFDVTNSAAGNDAVIGIGRNTDATNFGATFWVDIDDVQVGNSYRFEIGGTDTLSSVEYLGLALYSKRIA